MDDDTAADTANAAATDETTPGSGPQAQRSPTAESSDRLSLILEDGRALLNGQAVAREWRPPSGNSRARTMDGPPAPMA